MVLTLQFWGLAPSGLRVFITGNSVDVLFSANGAEVVRETAKLMSGGANAPKTRSPIDENENEPIRKRAKLGTVQNGAGASKT